MARVETQLSVVGVIGPTSRWPAARRSSPIRFRSVFHDFIQVGAALTHDLGIRLAVAMMILALLDVAWQRYRHEKGPSHDQGGGQRRAAQHGG